MVVVVVCDTGGHADRRRVGEEAEVWGIGRGVVEDAVPPMEIEVAAGDG